MSPEVHLDRSIEGRETIACDEARVAGETLLASFEEDEKTWLIPLSNVVGVVGEAVEHEIDEVEYPGGRITDLVTCLR